MRVLFVDFDGVLNSDHTPVPSGAALWSAEQLDPALVRRLELLVAAARASIVVSSSWRLMHPPEALAGMLRMLGFSGIFAGVTPALYRTPQGEFMTRGHEVRAWLLEHPEVERYAILDDAEQFLPEQEPFLVRTDASRGLSESDAARALALLRLPDG